MRGKVIGSIFDQNVLGHQSWNVDERAGPTHWRDHPLLRELCGGKDPTSQLLFDAVEKNSPWQGHPERIKELIASGIGDRFLAQFVLGRLDWKNHPELVQALVEKGTLDDALDRYVFTQSHWKNNRSFRELCGGLPPTAAKMREGLAIIRSGQKVKSKSYLWSCTRYFSSLF